jgi:hypothetical protein
MPARFTEEDAARLQLPKVAWEVELNDSTTITYARTAAAAKWCAVEAYRDAFGSHQPWPSPLRASRAPRLDGATFDTKRLADLPGRRCYVRDFVEDRCA